MNGRRTFSKCVLGLVLGLGLSLLTAPAAEAGVGDVEEHLVPTPSSAIFDITGGPDGALWYTAHDRVGRMSPDGSVIEFVVGPSHDAWNITAGPDGNLWFTDRYRDQIVRLETDGSTQSFDTLAQAYLHDITAGPDGNLWFTEWNTDTIGRITPQGVVEEFRLPSPNSNPEGITAGPDGNVWFTESTGNRIGRITPQGDIDEFAAPAGASPGEIALGPDGNLWFTETAGNRIAHVTPEGTVTEHRTLSAPGSRPWSIAAGMDGALWFTAQNADTVGRITVSGALTEFPLKSGATPLAVAAGPDGNMWVVEAGRSAIARVSSDLAPLRLYGSGQANADLFCGSDIWGPAYEVTVNWQRDGTTIQGATKSTYAPTLGDVGAAITCSTHTRLPSVLTDATVVSNAVTVRAADPVPVQPSPSAPAAEPVPVQPSTPTAEQKATPLVLVWAPGVAKVRPGKVLRVQFGASEAAKVDAVLSSRKTLRKSVTVMAGSNTLRWRLPKRLKAGMYSLQLQSGAVTVSTKVRVLRRRG